MQDNRKKAEELYRLYEKPMYYIALAVLKEHSRAEDAVSDAFCKLIINIDRLKEADAPQTKQYVIKTIRSCAINIYRKNSRQAEYIEEDIPVQCGGLYTIEPQEIAAELLGMLNDTDAKIVVLRGRDDMPYKDIARILKMSESAVRKRYERARKIIIEKKGTEYYEQIY